jgi:hypothetical protein
MYLLLLGFGVGLSAAGILLAGAGLSIREGSFDSGLFTPGIVAAVGGFLLIGLGLALRTLQRIQRRLRRDRCRALRKSRLQNPSRLRTNPASLIHSRLHYRQARHGI